MNDLIFEALVRLHGRGVQTALEILTLMESGYPNGANARWRTLYEIVVVSYFIKDHDQDTAKRFLLHENIHNYRSISIYLNDKEKFERHNKLLGYALPDEDEIRSIELNKIKLCGEYEEDFSKDYGWAFPIIKDPHLDTLAKEVGLDHYRPYYKMANIHVHAGSKGIKFSLGTDISNFIHCGPSHFGMADPGQLTACSLYQINVALLMTKPSIERLAICHALNLLLDKTLKSFIDVQNSLEK